MNIAKITTPIFRTLGKATSTKSKFTQMFNEGFKYLEPNKGDNSFCGLATIMGLFVVIPRIKTALKRNPDNKEATKDEIKEILFRDLQTIAIILFGLKSMNALVSNLATKFTGIPMVNNPYKNVFGKGNEDLLQRGKNFLSNIVSTISPFSKATRSMDAGDVEDLYTNYKSKEEVIKLIDSIESKGGRQEDVFAKIKESVIARINKTIRNNKLIGHYQNGTLTTQPEIDELSRKKAIFEKLTLTDFKNNADAIDNDCMAELLEALNNEETNVLAKSVNGLNSYLKTAALGIEVGYLGFGLPALNQKRLEKKYLSEKPIGEQKGDTFSSIDDRHIKAQEIKLYSQFMK